MKTHQRQVLMKILVKMRIKAIKTGFCKWKALVNESQKVKDEQ